MFLLFFFFLLILSYRKIWDTAGQGSAGRRLFVLITYLSVQKNKKKKERYHSLAPMYYRGAQAAIVVYDITSAESFERAQAWVKVYCA